MIPVKTKGRSNTATPESARRLLRKDLEGWDGPEVVEDAVLLVSELVTNAIVHAHADPASVAITKSDEQVRVEVNDPSSGPLVHTPKTDPSVPGGFGLSIVDDVSDRWGVTSDADGKTVWFELHARPAP